MVPAPVPGLRTCFAPGVTKGEQEVHLVQSSPADVHRTLEYSSDVFTWRLLWLPLLAFFGSLAFLVYDPDSRAAIQPWVGILVGGGWLLYAMVARFIPEKPMLVLSPGGMIWRNVSRMLIPWHVIENVTSTDHEVWHRGSKLTYENATVVWVPRRFYNRRIFIQSLFWRGPFWGNNFIHDRDSTGIVIVPELISLDPELLRAEIAARWEAFRETKPVSVPQVGARTEPTVEAAAAAPGRKSARRCREELADDRVAWLDNLKWAGLSLLFVLASYLLYSFMTSDRSARHADGAAVVRATIASMDAFNAEQKRQRDAEEAAYRWRNAEPGSVPPQPTAPVMGHAKTVVALAPVGGGFLSASFDGTIKLWDLNSARVLRDAGLHADGIRALHVLPGGTQFLSAASDGRVALRALDDGEVLRVIETRQYGDLASLAVSADGRRAISVHRRGALPVWDIETGTLVKNLGDAGMQAAALSADGKLAITAGHDGAVWLWDVEAGSILRSLGGHTCCAQSVAFMPGEQFAISGGGDYAVRMWDVATGREVRSFSGHSALVTELAVSADGRRIISGAFDGTARLWDAETGKDLAHFTIGRRVSAVAFANDGTILVGGDEKGAIHLWDQHGLSRKPLAGAVRN